MAWPVSHLFWHFMWTFRIGYPGSNCQSVGWEVQLCCRTSRWLLKSEITILCLGNKNYKSVLFSRFLKWKRPYHWHLTCFYSFKLFKIIFIFFLTSGHYRTEATDNDEQVSSQDYASILWQVDKQSKSNQTFIQKLWIDSHAYIIPN